MAASFGAATGSYQHPRASLDTGDRAVPRSAVEQHCPRTSSHTALVDPRVYTSHFPVSLYRPFRRLSEKAAERRNVYRTATRNLLPSSIRSDMYVLSPINGLRLFVKTGSHKHVVPLGLFPTDSSGLRFFLWRIQWRRQSSPPLARLLKRLRRLLICVSREINDRTLMRIKLTD